MLFSNIMVISIKVGKFLGLSCALQLEQARGKRGSTKHKRQQSDNTFDRIGEDVEPLSPTKLHEQAQEEKKKYTALRKQGKDSEAMKAFKRAKELDRQAEALEKEIKQRRRVSAGPSSPIVGHQSKMHASKLNRDSLALDSSSLSKEKVEPVASGRKTKASTREEVTEKQSLNEKEDLLKDLKELGWTDKEIREAEKNPVAKTEEQLLAELAAEVRPKPDRPANIAAPGCSDALLKLFHRHSIILICNGLVDNFGSLLGVSASKKNCLCVPRILCNVYLKSWLPCLPCPQSQVSLTV